ncbi:hypothetical protein H9Y04_39930 [Streptomyces sp. TRM66268-LWL]|uniref:DUF3180 domain-containing protein n=1 Tax=Streptomyces polyasparticus TaxID=2767826 RepID=A0ABR7STB7_9ACTN|nr:hypothetical protein [Streptomyces polyasparticus]MBC9718714.1 hypothetical protein [Streptomyces polyasparticus]
MSTAVQRALGAALVVAGLVLVAFFADKEIVWFEGRPLGIVLIVIGVIDIGESVWRGSSRGRRAD